jgi:hypothetical protein
MPASSLRRTLASAATLVALGCTSAAVDPITQQMDVTTATPSMTVVAGSGILNNLVVTRTNRASGPVRMEATDLPAGVTARFSPNPLPPSDAAATVMSLSAGASTRPGSYEIRVRAIGDGIGDGVRIMPLTVRAAP